MTTLPAPEKPTVTPTRSPATPNRRRRHWLRWLVVTVVVLLLAIFGAGSWYVSGFIDSGALKSTPGTAIPGYDDVQVVSVTSTEITLEKGPDTGDNFAAAKFAMAWQGGYGQIGPATVSADGTVTRTLDFVTGSAPTVGQLAGIERSYWLGDVTAELGEATRTS